LSLVVSPPAHIDVSLGVATVRLDLLLGRRFQDVAVVGEVDGSAATVPDAEAGVETVRVHLDAREIKMSAIKSAIN
jgi:hypothetical protein